MMWKLIDRLKGIKKPDILTQLPIYAVVILFINVVFYSMASTVVFSFLPQMVKLFGATEVNTGYYAGIIASSLFLGRFFFSMFWGYLADTIGRKRSAILTGSILLITTLSFGFSRSFYWATVTRFLQGCSMGQIIVSKAILADICDDTSMPLGISIVMTAFSVGYVIGPSIGGFLVFPGSQFPDAFPADSVFTKFSVLLPLFVIAIGLGIGVVLTILFIPSDKKQVAQERHLLVQDTSTPPSYGSIEDNMIRVSNIRSDDYVDISTDAVSYLAFEASGQVLGLGLFDKFKQSKVVAVLKIRECLFSSLLYGMFSLVDAGFIEMFPVYAATDPRYKGLGFTTKEIGVALMVISIVLVILQITVLPKLNTMFGSKRVLIGSNLALTFLCPMLPTVAAIPNRTVLWVCLIIIVFLVRACAFNAYLSINIFVNNSVGPSLLGTANGVGLMFASIGRLSAPLIAGSVYSWSLTNIKGLSGNKHALGYPLNQFLAFFVLSAWTIIIAVLTTMMPENMDYKTDKKDTK